MSSYQHLRQRDLRSIYLLLGECFELGADPIAWRQHMLVRLGELLLAVSAVLIETTFVPTVASDDSAKNIAALGADIGGDARKRKLTRHRGRDSAVSTDQAKVCTATLVSTGGVQVEGGCPPNFAGTCCDEYVNGLRRQSEFELCCSCRNGTAMRVLKFRRATSAREFESHDRRMVQLFLREASNAPASRLAPNGELSMIDMAPRLQDVMHSLFEGKSEKQVAISLGISPHTVHEYTLRLYRRFHVSGRGELMARCARYSPVLMRATDFPANWEIRRT